MRTHPDLPKAFAELGVEVRFLQALRKMGFTEPSDIQRAMIPAALSGKDLLGQARTGTGKTAAFGLPTLQRIEEGGPLQALCLCPTRELAVQVAAEIRRLAEFTKIHCVPVYGGQKISHQLHLLGRRHEFIVATPGRAYDFLQRGSISFDRVNVAILDEVDRMLDIGFRDDIKRLLSRIKSKHQTIFVSATLEDEIVRLAKQFMTDPVEINVSHDEVTVTEVEQYYCSVEPQDKHRLLRRLLAQEEPSLAIIFCNTKHSVRKLAKRLHSDGIEAKEIHGDLVQSRREKIMDRFRRHKIHVLIATDLASRGIDVSSISHIINYDIPPDPEVYVHRIGRTARMGATGKAFTFVTSEQGKELTLVEMLINKQLTPAEIDGFVPRPVEPKSDEEMAASQAPASRYAEPAFASSSSGWTPPPGVKPKRTLGSKFKRPRRRR